MEWNNDGSGNYAVASSSPPRGCRRAECRGANGHRELKRLAASHLRHEKGPVTIQTTALVHEAFLRLAGSRLPECENRSHFYGIAARVMRQVLVDMARRRRTAKREARSKLP